MNKSVHSSEWLEILKDVYKAGVMEERQKLDYMTNFYATSRKALKKFEEALVEARKDELQRLEQYAEFVSPDRIDMVGMHRILDRIKELDSTRKQTKEAQNG